MLTTRGWAVLVLAIVGFLLADLYSSRFLYLVSLAVAVAFVLSYVQLRVSSTGLKVTRSIAPNPCFESSQTSVEVQVQRRGLSAQVVGIQDQLPSSFRATGGTLRFGPYGRSIRYLYRLEAAERGEYEVGPSLILLRDVYGLFSARANVGAPTRLMVYPRYSQVDTKIEMRSLELLGPTTTHRRGSSSDFLSIRRYVHGDPVKSIHWRSSAKVGQLMVRELEAEEKGSVGVVLDCSRGNDLLFETGVRAAASIAVTCLSMGMDVRLFLADDDLLVVDRGRGQVQYHAVLSALARVRRGGGLSAAEMLRRVERVSGWRGSIFFVTPQVGRFEAEWAMRLSSRGIAVSLVLTGSPDDLGVAAAIGSVGLAAARMRGDEVKLDWIR